MIRWTRIDAGTGEETTETDERARRIIREHYQEAEDVIAHSLLTGYAIRCTFASYRPVEIP